MGKKGELSLNRRSFLKAAGLGLTGAAAEGLAPRLLAAEQASESAQRPNIVLLIADDTGWRDVGYNGSEIKTPNIDRMAREGVMMEQFYACPTCSPTRASILTGRPPSRYGILTPIAGRSKLSLPKEYGTLASLLRDAGYRTAQIGKWHLGLRPEVGPRMYGFDSSYGYLHGQIDQFTHIYKNGDRSWHRNEEFIDEEGHATDLIANEAVKLIRESTASQPFFLYTAFSVPHYPLQEDDRWIKPYEKSIANESRRLYAASMTHMDNAIGRVLAALEGKNLASNTLVIFISDNGGQQDWEAGSGEYNLRHGPYDVLGDNRPFRNWKGSLYEGGVRVPAVFYWRDTLKARKVSFPAHVMDFLPTLAAIVRAEVPPEMQVEGIDIGPALHGTNMPDERTIYWNTGRQLAVRYGDWKLIHHGNAVSQGKSELYNITRDPYEKNDLADEKITLTAQMREILARHRALDRIAE